MDIPIFQVDVFTAEIFRGNPAAVCPMESWPEDHILQGIAAENNLSETAFFVPREDHYHLRWFTPKTEVDLCGHATLASGFVFLNFINPSLERVEFSTMSGRVAVERDGEHFAIFFPSRKAAPAPAPDELSEGLGRPPEEALLARDYLAVYASEEEVRSLQPDFPKLLELDCLGIIATAPGENADFVSRFFAPSVGVPEDPVTGSAHCTLVPYWAHRLNKNKLHAFQVSGRGGELFCEDMGEQVKIAGEAVLFMKGQIRL